MLQRYVAYVSVFVVLFAMCVLCESTWLLIYVLCALSALSIECFYLQRFLCGSLAGSFVITWLVDSCILNEGFLHSCGASLSRSPPLSASPLSCFLSLSCSVSQPLSLSEAWNHPHSPSARIIFHPSKRPQDSHIHAVSVYFSIHILRGEVCEEYASEFEIP